MPRGKGIRKRVGNRLREHTTNTKHVERLNEYATIAGISKEKIYETVDKEKMQEQMFLRTANHSYGGRQVEAMDHFITRQPGLLRQCNFHLRLISYIDHPLCFRRSNVNITRFGVLHDLTDYRHKIFARNRGGLADDVVIRGKLTASLTRIRVRVVRNEIRKKIRVEIWGEFCVAFSMYSANAFSMCPRSGTWKVA